MFADNQMRSERETEITIARAREGDMDALGDLYREHAHVVMRVAYHLTASRDEAEDIVQDVFIGLPEALRRLSDTRSFPSWLRRVAARTALMRMRGEQRRRQSPIEGRPRTRRDRGRARVTAGRAPDRVRAQGDRGLFPR